MVGRPREFDVDSVLDAAMAAFWAKGYEATSLTDLTQATGLHKGSLYQAFGDKHALFIQALKRYLSEMERHKTEILGNAATPLEGIRAVLHSVIDMVDTDSEVPKGCMAMNTLIEMVPHDEEVHGLMESHMKVMCGSMQNTIERARQAGEISSERSAEQITMMLMTFVSGLTAHMKGSMCKADAHILLDALLESLI